MSSAVHEDFSRSDHVQGSSDRSFGLVFAVFFAVVGLWPLRHQQGVRYWALGLAAGLLLLSFTVPRVLHPANYLWMRLALLLNKIVSPVAMGILFFLVATPTGIVLRLMGKDALRLRWDREAASYWLKRSPPGPEPASMRHQF